MLRNLIKCNTRLFTSMGQPPEFTNYFLVRLNYSPDGYYETYQHKQTFADEVKKLEDNQQARVLGGDQFPKNSTILYFNCQSDVVPNTFVEQCVYKRKGLLTGFEVQALDQVSTEKFEKIWNFYQPKIK